MSKEILWHSLNLKEVSERLLADFKNGLTDKEIEKRQKKFGKNIFEKKDNFFYLKLLWKQLKSPLVFILIIAGIIAFGLKEYTNMIVIFIAVLINTAVGMYQEGRASRALEKLKILQKKYITVIRNGSKKLIESTEIVPGDIIVLQIGDFVPADARLIEEMGLEANESTLTGEWLAVEKDAKTKISEDARLTKMNNMVWMNTLITEGWGRAVVVNTAYNTEIGKIAKIIGDKDSVITPFQKSIKKLARFLGLIAVLALIAIFVFGIMRGEKFSEMFLISLAVAVAAIPEGLPVAVTVSLALGTGRMLEKGGLIKNLIAAETLGSTDIILTDKTGTLTKAEMQVSKIMTLVSESEKFEKEHKDRLHILKLALLSSDAFIENPNDELKEWIIRGKEIDSAIMKSAIESGLMPIEILKEFPRIDFIPFDNERRFSASMNKSKDNSSYVYTIGAPETIFSFCEKIYKNGKEIKLTKKEIEILKNSYKKEAASGARIIAVAYRKGNWDKFPHHKETDGIFEKMVFGGFICFHDPLRGDVFEAIKEAKKAMVRPVMVTGDHVLTAQKIAQEAGLLTKNGLIIDGDALEKMSDKELEENIEKIDVFARVLPKQKLRIVQMWQKRGAVVAMTGDGVNDAPALKYSDIGLALGSGTEVAKEASDMILLNNSFKVIISAIEEGRRILDNLKKTIAYLLSTSFSEIIIIGVAIISGMPLPVLPAQILWINIIEEGFMNFVFAFEPKESDLMGRNPKTQSARNILTGDLKKFIFILAMTTGALLIAILFILYNLNYPIEKIRTIIFSALAIDSIFFTFSLKNFKKPIWQINIFSNYYLIASLAISILLLFSALFIPVLQNLLSLTPISIMEFGAIIGIGLANLLIIEIIKYSLFRKK